jgi:amino acid permease
MNMVYEQENNFGKNISWKKFISCSNNTISKPAPGCHLNGIQALLFSVNSILSHLFGYSAYILQSSYNQKLGVTEGMRDIMNEQRDSLSKVLSRTDVLALSFGTMIGWGWVMLAGYWITEAGVLGAILAFALGTIMCILVGLTYAELTPALPLAGGEMVFAYRGLGYKWGWIAAWSICLAYIGVAAWEGIAISTALNYIYPLA